MIITDNKITCKNIDTIMEREGYFPYYRFGNRRGYLKTKNGRMIRALETVKEDGTIKIYEFKNNEFIKIKINEI